jgi:hypothetical protein
MLWFRMADSRDPRDGLHRVEGSRGHGAHGLSVGGASGIHVDGAGVTVGGVFVAGPGGGPGGASPGGPGAPIGVSPASPFATLERGASFVARHPEAAAGALLFGATAITTTSAVAISLLQVSWLLLAVPAMPALACLLGAVVLIAGRRRPATGESDSDVERRLLGLAVAQSGQLTVTGAAVGLGIPLAEAEAALMRLVRSGHVAVENDAATGAVLYVFPDIHAGLVDRPRRLL